MKCLRFVWTTVSDSQKQTRLPIAETRENNNLRKRYFIARHVTKYSPILEVFWQPCGESPGNKHEKFADLRKDQTANKVAFGLSTGAGYFSKTYEEY